MNHKSAKQIVVLLMSLVLTSVQAQEAVVATGGNATGSGGSAHYSVGQVFYTNNTGANGSVSQGVQQSYVIYAITGMNESAINLELSVYPNPTTNYLELKVEKTDNLFFQLIDLQGRVIENRSVSNSTTTIEMAALPTATYFLKVIKNNQSVKTFKIIKN